MKFFRINHRYLLCFGLVVVGVVCCWYRHADPEIDTHMLRPINTYEVPENFAAPMNAYHHWKTRETKYFQKVKTRSCKPAKHIYFLKTHKCGSTTFASLLVRFAFKLKLSFGQHVPGLQNNGWLGWPESLLPKHVKPTYVKNLATNMELEDHKDERALIDIITLHTIYNQTTLDKIMPNDTVKVAIIRQPFSQFQSAFDSKEFDFVEYFSIGGPNPMKTYLERPSLRDSSIFGRHFQNFISTEFGMQNRSENNLTAIKEFISYIDKNFNLVTIMEYFVESLVLLKRMLCWSTEDIIFLHLNKNPNKIHRIKPGLGQNYTYRYIKALHRKWSMADYICYDYFNKTLWKKIEKEGVGFYDELNDFQFILTRLTSFCGKESKETSSKSENKKLLIPKSKWHSAFEVTEKNCSQMKVDVYTNLWYEFTLP